ncbi:unnamed protein product [Albugo candida]|uniref:Uncharacterized protein n=1 Tax=Albugo candida TaxID=65357 RepID=A0A024FX27_9STRA|nr:unnamed protein product [Albugo candida]|eukprot:CCI11561.1 unnamed protein product [Albugo candida]
MKNCFLCLNIQSNHLLSLLCFPYLYHSFMSEFKLPSHRPSCFLQLHLIVSSSTLLNRASTQWINRFSRYQRMDGVLSTDESRVQRHLTCTSSLNQPLRNRPS